MELRSALVGIMTLLPTLVTSNLCWLTVLCLRRPLLLLLKPLLESWVGWVERTTTKRLLELLWLPRRRHPIFLLLDTT